ncbi:hypothetical protein Herbaro_09280 [Herbaspirillum sp. WKF16]|uniref:hypothetical protein n=1 Tax=Herbaspirillum sp. WKF16 TaxID=3028312 RepID=UPI0023A9BB57|nr:hypothetical protein [Herbaspirillum sp. WKF16]WDZ97952.1 hypothetical protein Herbaro_09280 [Herbaspirillum sp. WKF16]
MKDPWKIFMKAAAETPRLYFAPIIGLIDGVKRARAEMAKTQDVVVIRSADSAKKIKALVDAAPKFATPAKKKRALAMSDVRIRRYERATGRKKVAPSTELHESSFQDRKKA